MRQSKTCVVTGGAGFIGCAIAPFLSKQYSQVIALDSLHPQVHPERARPIALPEEVELVIGDVTDEAAWRNLLDRVRPDTVIHLAAETGTGQSLNEARRHTHVNVTGTATMLDAFAACGHIPDQFVLTSSRAVYGEGAWRDCGGCLLYPGQRTQRQLAAKQWDFLGLTYAPARADLTSPNPVSVYGATKLTQEHIMQAWASAFGGHVKILRLQNVYGPGQSLANPYTGIVSLFCRLARSGKSIPLYEDGNMLRDFVLIDDVAAAIAKSLASDAGAGRVLDVGTGVSTTIGEIAGLIARHYSAPEPHVCEKYRFGDVRHAACDVGQTRDLLGWSCVFDVASGVERLATWIEARLPHN